MSLNTKWTVEERQLCRKIGHYRQRMTEVLNELELLHKRVCKLENLLVEYDMKVNVLKHELGPKYGNKAKQRITTPETLKKFNKFTN